MSEKKSISFHFISFSILEISVDSQTEFKYHKDIQSTLYSSATFFFSRSTATFSNPSKLKRKLKNITCTKSFDFLSVYTKNQFQGRRTEERTTQKKTKLPNEPREIRVNRGTAKQNNVNVNVNGNIHI